MKPLQPWKMGIAHRVNRPEDEPSERAMTNDVRRRDFGHNIRRTASHVFGAHGAGDGIDRVHAVLEGDEERVWTEQRR